MKKFAKTLKTLALSILALPVVFSAMGSIQVSAAESSTTAKVTLHKLIYADKRGVKENTGSIDPSFTGEPLDGAEFTVYDVTAQYKALRSGNTPLSPEAAIAEIQRNYVATDVTKVASGVTTNGGLVTFSDLALKAADGKTDQVYLFLETKTPNTVTVTQKSAPIVLAMPIYKLDAEGKSTENLNTDIHLYPKNETRYDTKEFINVDNKYAWDKNGDGTDYVNVSTGDILDFNVTLNIPADIDKKDSYTLTDTPTENLKFVKDSLGLFFDGGLVAGEDYTFTEKGNGFELALNTQSAKVKALAGKAIVVGYQMQLTADVKPEVLEENKAIVKINNETVTEMITHQKPTDPEKPTDPKDPEDPNKPEEPKDPEDPEKPTDPNNPDPEDPTDPPVKFGTGGRKFVKTDAQSGNTLQGAEFVVKQGNNFAIFTTNATTGEYVFAEWTTDKAKGTKIVSDKDGKFAVKGLINGDYALEETKAPEGYALLTDDYNFNVVHGKYEDTSFLETVKNTPKGLLPSTGGNGIYAFLAVGTAMMIGAYVWFSKSRKQANV
jgi:fimbrial isopeptide formation D2 family protein/LPXTG-motif cell wall-anchored protein